MKPIKTSLSILNIPENVEIHHTDNRLHFSGPLGQNRLNLLKLDSRGEFGIRVQIPEKKILLWNSNAISCQTLEALIKNKIDGVTRGFVVSIRLVGIGYRVLIENNTLIFKVGFSHDIRYRLPESVRPFLLEANVLSLFGLDKNQITQIAATIRGFKPPSPYKGKGIRLLDEKLHLKQGKQK